MSIDFQTNSNTNNNKTNDTKQTSNEISQSSKRGAYRNQKFHKYSSNMLGSLNDSASSPLLSSHDYSKNWKNVHIQMKIFSN